MRVWISGIWCGLSVANMVQAETAWQGSVTVEGRGHFYSPLHPGQQTHGAAVAARMRGHHRWASGVELVVHPFVRVDSGYDDPPYMDLREGYVGRQEPDWGWRLGVGQVSWGASDVYSIVDMINQRDRLFFWDDDYKLGQPMAEALLYLEWGTIALYLLPYFREAPFPDRRERLRPEWPVDTRRPVYEAGSASKTLDWAVRGQHRLGALDFAWHWFQGRNRVPYLVPSALIPAEIRTPAAGDSPPQWVPVYEEITQVGLEAQWAVGGSLLKGEGLYRDGLFYNHLAAIGGLEYTWYGVAGSRRDMSVIIEYAYDERGKKQPTQTLFDNDVFIGSRLYWGDFADTQLEAGVLLDLDDQEKVFVLRARRRLGSHQHLQLDGWFLRNISRDSLLSDVRRDDAIRVQWTRYF